LVIVAIETPVEYRPFRSEFDQKLSPIVRFSTTAGQAPRSGMGYAREDLFALPSYPDVT
jgi:hypothetical protein